MENGTIFWHILLHTQVLLLGKSQSLVFAQFGMSHILTRYVSYASRWIRLYWVVRCTVAALKKVECHFSQFVFWLWEPHCSALLGQSQNLVYMEFGMSHFLTYYITYSYRLGSGVVRCTVAASKKVEYHFSQFVFWLREPCYWDSLKIFAFVQFGMSHFLTYYVTYAGVSIRLYRVVGCTVAASKKVECHFSHFVCFAAAKQ